MEKERNVDGIKLDAAENVHWTGIKNPKEIAKYILDSQSFKEKWKSFIVDIDKELQKFETK